MQSILLIDDEKQIRQAFIRFLKAEGYEVTEAENGQAGWELFSTQPFGLVICDIKMPKMDGIDFLQKAKAHNPDVPVIIMSGHGNIPTAVDAVKKGAYDYLEKPFGDLDKIMILVKNALASNQLKKETRALRRQLNQQTVMVGESAPITDIKDMVSRVADTDARVLITGENGVGKELVAKSIHEQSRRAQQPFVEVNCAAIPGELIESELFGHEKGSFTSAIKQRIGKFEQANGGTLFLDEIGDMSLAAQAKVLRALQEGRITRVGGDKDIVVDVRVLAATNKDLLAEVEAKQFRLDLYHRLSVIKIVVPPLRERKEDIPRLTEKFLADIGAAYGQPAKIMSADALTALQELPFHGNIRELRNLVERLVILSGEHITLADVQKYGLS